MVIFRNKEKLTKYYEQNNAIEGNFQRYFVIFKQVANDQRNQLAYFIHRYFTFVIISMFMTIYLLWLMLVENKFKFNFKSTYRNLTCLYILTCILVNVTYGL